MALWSSGVTWSSGILWSPAAPPSGGSTKNNKPKHNTMARKKYYPTLIEERGPWHTNLAAKLAIYATTLELSSTETNQAVADNLVLAYGLSSWRINQHTVGPACTAALADLASGTSGDPFVFPTVSVPTAPTLPVGITSVLPGALDRTFLLVKEIKAKKTYTLAMGLDMGIVGEEMPPPPPGTVVPPRISLSLNQTPTMQQVLVKFFKDRHEGIWLESRRGTGPWEFIIISSQSPYTDSRALLVPGQAEIREYRAMFWDKGQPSGDWCDVAKITVSP
jgi:hypothetical protein